LENLNGRACSEDLGVDGWIVLEWIYGNRVGRCGLGASLRIGTSDRLMWT
jgi:hypothetical protein